MHTLESLQEAAGTNERLSTFTQTITATPLQFRHMTSADSAAIAPILATEPSRTCDYTVGGMIMWADYFHYDAAIVDDTLFVKGVTENDITTPAFSLPVGNMPLGESLALIRDYCAEHDIIPILSAVPEDRLEEILTHGPAKVEELVDWADYLYDIDVMSTFAGKRMSKKRNHVNRFRADNPDAEFRPITRADIPELVEFVSKMHPALNKSLTAEYELMKTIEIMNDLDSYPTFEGALLRIPGKGVAAFTIGEAVGDTLYAHIEKIDHQYNGAGETVSSRFCAMMKERHPELKYVNREDDSGDPGLRKAKLDYHPLTLLKKYNVTLL